MGRRRRRFFAATVVVFLCAFFLLHPFFMMMTGCPSSCNPMQRALTVVKSFNQHRKKFQPTREKASTGMRRWRCGRVLLEPTFDRATCYNHIAKCYNKLRTLLQLALHFASSHKRHLGVFATIDGTTCYIQRRVSLQPASHFSSSYKMSSWILLQSTSHLARTGTTS